MSITFKRFHASARLSEETVAYDTDVLFNGKPLGSCRNDGRGGEGYFHAHKDVPKETIEQANAWARSQHYRESDGSVALGPDGNPLTMGGIAEYCDYLAEETLVQQQYTAAVKRKLKKNAFFTDPARGGEIFALKNVSYSGPAMKDVIEKRYPGAVVLNALSVESAIEVFKANDERLRKAEAEAKAAKKPKGP